MFQSFLAFFADESSSDINNVHFRKQDAHFSFHTIQNYKALYIQAPQFSTLVRQIFGYLNGVFMHPSNFLDLLFIVLSYTFSVSSSPQIPLAFCHCLEHVLTLSLSLSRRFNFLSLLGLFYSLFFFSSSFTSIILFLVLLSCFLYFSYLCLSIVSPFLSFCSFASLFDFLPFYISFSFAFFLFFMSCLFFFSMLF